MTWSRQRDMMHLLYGALRFSLFFTTANMESFKWIGLCYDYSSPQIESQTRCARQFYKKLDDDSDSSTDLDKNIAKVWWKRVWSRGRVILFRLPGREECGVITKHSDTESCFQEGSVGSGIIFLSPWGRRRF